MMINPITQLAVRTCMLLVLVCGIGQAAVVWTDGTSRSVAVGLGEASVRVPFVLRNDGSNDLLIDKVKTSCGCTTVDRASQRILPGETGEIAVVFDVGTRSGTVRKKATVSYREVGGASGVQVLDLEFDIAALTMSDSSVIAFHSRDPEPAWGTQRLTVTVLDPDVQVTGIDASEATNFEATVVPESTGYAWVIEVTPKGSFTGERLLEPVYLLTDHPQERYQRLRYHCYLRHEIPGDE